MSSKLRKVKFEPKVKPNHNICPETSDIYLYLYKVQYLHYWWVYATGRQKEDWTAKRLSVTYMTGLLLACFVGNSLNIDVLCSSTKRSFLGNVKFGGRFFPQVAQARNMSISKYKDLYGKKTCRFRNLRKWKDFNKKQLNLLKMCVTSLLCGPRTDLCPFYGFLCKRFSLYIKVYIHKNP